MDPLLTTERLLLRRFTPADGPDIAALDADPAVMRYLDAPVPPATTLAETLPEIIGDYDELPDGQGQFATFTRTDGRFLGWVSILPVTSQGLTPGPGVLELGYRLTPAAWGHGYATEGALALVRHAFTTLGAERIVATTMAVNTGSRRVMEKAGLRYVRTFHGAWDDPLPGAEEGEVEYALTLEQWKTTGAPTPRQPS
ncbi:GNAT family N-acetyltransferase [Kitasatospora sp. NPDC101183]|uniref:GNAT family N-acetyltransferase n=1 Tax=Kitasatospora sp. NPDC101183 TaxID=3364100 RepID=UPI00382128A7